MQKEILSIYDLEKITAPTLLIIGTRDRTAIGKAFAPKELQPLMGLYQNLGKETQKKIKITEIGGNAVTNALGKPARVKTIPITII